MKLWSKKTLLLLILSNVFFVATIVIELTKFSSILYRVCLLLSFALIIWYYFSLYRLNNPKKEDKDGSNK